MRILQVGAHLDVSGWDPILWRNRCVGLSEGVLKERQSPGDRPLGRGDVKWAATGGPAFSKGERFSLGT